MKLCPNCNIEMSDAEQDLWTGGYWNKCPKCGLVDDNPNDNFEVNEE